MNLSTAQKLIELNRKFYTDFSTSFSATRQRLQPGVHKLLDRLAEGDLILDLGCGNGNLAHKLAQTKFLGSYLGLDFSVPLLEDAATPRDGFKMSFREVDLTAMNWAESLQGSHFSIITAFAVLHHIPDATIRINILQKIRELLQPGGIFIHSNWQFLNSKKITGRIQPWEKAGISANELDEGDYLLDWRGGGCGLRYIHHYSEEELNQLAIKAGFRVVESFFSDGEGARLSLYQIWE